MDFEKPQEKEEISFEELQTFINDPDLDLPELRRDISQPENIRWLLRNILIRNQDKTPSDYFDALKKLL